MFDSCLIRSVLNFQCTENNDFVFRFDSLVLPDEKCLLLAAVLGSVQPLQALLSLKNIKIFVKVREEGGGQNLPTPTQVAFLPQFGQCKFIFLSNYIFEIL